MRRWVPAVLLLIASQTVNPARAQATDSLRAQLSWSSTNPSVANLTSPGESSRLYLHLLHGVSSYKGAELDVKWDPSGDPEAACIAHIATDFKTSTGATCTYLNRGTSLPIVDADEPGHFHVSWANSQAFAGCAAGAIVVMTFAFDGCEDATASFAVCSLSLLDSSNVRIDVPAESLGVPATVLGGGEYAPECASEPSSFALAPIPSQTVTIGNSLAVDPHLLTETSGIVTWTGANLPPNATVDGATGRLVWTADSTIGMYEDVTIVATESDESASTSFDITSTPTDSMHFGTFQAGLHHTEFWNLVDNLGANWVHYTLFPMIDDWTTLVTNADDIVSQAQSRGLDVVFDVSSTENSTSLDAYWPPMSMDSTRWDQTLYRLARRYSLGNSAPNSTMSGLTSSVKWWHVEEESSFWPPDTTSIDPCGCNYVLEMMHARTAILAGNPSAKFVLIGLASKPLQSAAYRERREYLTPRDDQNGLIDTTDVSDAWMVRTTNWLSADGGFGDGECCRAMILSLPLADTVSTDPLVAPRYESYWYDAADFHSYDRAPILDAEADWVGFHQSARPSAGTTLNLRRALWCEEMGGPAFSTVAPDKFFHRAYTDSMNSGWVWSAMSQALASNVQRVAWELLPAGGQFVADSVYTFGALLCDTCGLALKKPSFYSYQTVRDLLHGYSSTIEHRFPFPDSSGWVAPSSSRTDNAIRDFHVFEEKFILPNGDQASVMWAPETTLTFELVRQSGSAGAYQVNAASRDRAPGAAFTLTAADSVPIVLGPIPMIVTYSGRFYLRKMHGAGVTDIRNPKGIPDDALWVRANVLGTQLKVAWSLSAGDEPLDLALVDVAGRVRVRQALPTGRRDFDFALGATPYSDVPAGSYFIVLLRGARQVASSRVVIVR